MPAIGARCHELRIVDADLTWRIIYRRRPRRRRHLRGLLEEDAGDAQERH